MADAVPGAVVVDPAVVGELAGPGAGRRAVAGARADDDQRAAKPIFATFATADGGGSSQARCREPLRPRECGAGVDAASFRADTARLKRMVEVSVPPRIRTSTTSGR